LGAIILGRSRQPYCGARAIAFVKDECCPAFEPDELPDLHGSDQVAAWAAKDNGNFAGGYPVSLQLERREIIGSDLSFDRNPLPLGAICEIAGIECRPINGGGRQRQRGGADNRFHAFPPSIAPL
jgi:hypothetical protein